MYPVCTLGLPNDPELTGEHPKSPKAHADHNQDTPCTAKAVHKATGGARCSDWLGVASATHNFTCIVRWKPKFQCECR